MSEKKAPTKKDEAVKIINRMLGRKTPAARKDILAELQEKVGLTPNGAATYYQNVVKGKW